MLYHIHRHSQSNCETNFKRCRQKCRSFITCMNKKQSSHFTLLSSIMRLAVILFSSGFSCAAMLICMDFRVTVFLGFTIIHWSHTSAVAVACWIPWTSKQNIRIRQLYLPSPIAISKRDIFFFHCCCGHSDARWTFAMNAFISCSELMYDKKKCHSTELHLFTVQFSFHLFRIYLLVGFPKFGAFFFLSIDNINERIYSYYTSTNQITISSKWNASGENNSRCK